MIKIQEIADKIEIPVENWAGRCHEIAVKALQEGLVDGEAIYGHYHGFISDDCEMFSGRSFTHHGWIETKDSIIDPTRWVFENVEPYIYEGPKDDPDYDMGGNRVRKMFMNPPPAFDETQKKWTPTENIKPFAKLMLEYDGEQLCLNQVVWLANLPLDMLGDMAKPVYEWIVNDVGFSGFIPLDNRNYILGD